MNSSDAEFKMAMLCASYLCFDCFRPETSQRDLEQCSANGSYAFQQYAVCNWIQHVQSLKECWELLDSADCTLIYNACRVLLQRDLPHQFLEILPDSKPAKPPYTALNKALCSLNDEYERVGSISDNDIAPTMQRMHQVRTAVEHLFSTSTNLSSSRLLTDSYGAFLFKCPILKCPSFQQGFATQSARDHHYKVHEPPFVCPHQGCEYEILGFLAETTLKTHLRLCHDSNSNQITFPKVKPRSVEKALNNAIDNDDLAAIDHLANELSSIVDRKPGFLLRAVQNGSQESAILISKLLGTAAEFTHAVKRCTAVSEAARKGYAEALKIFLNSCETLHVRAAESKTGFLNAVENGHEAVVRLLLDEGLANVNDIALREAASRGHEAVVRLLLDRIADISAEDGYKSTALHLAAENGHEAIAQLLLEKGAKTEGKTNNGMTVLHEAVRHGQEALVQLLLDRNADISAEDGYKSTALHLAAENGHEAIAQLLLNKGAKTEGSTNNGMTALLEASRHGHDAIVRLLLDHNADMTVENVHKSTALHLAAGFRHEAVVRLLLDKGVKIEGRDGYGRTALHKAVRAGCEAVVRLLLDRDADIEATDATGQTALHIGIEARTQMGWPARNFAASNELESVVQMLLDRGANIMAQSNDGRTALQRADNNGRENNPMVQLLRSISLFKAGIWFAS